MATTINTKNQRTIFLIDDDPDMLELNRTILEFEGYKVISAQSGEEALITLENVEPLDLILLDYNLPNMNGAKFLKTFEKQNKKLFEKTPVVFLTSQLGILNTKAYGIIQKSSDIDGLLYNVDRCINTFVLTPIPA